MNYVGKLKEHLESFYWEQPIDNTVELQSGFQTTLHVNLIFRDRGSSEDEARIEATKRALKILKRSVGEVKMSDETAELQYPAPRQLFRPQTSPSPSFLSQTSTSTIHSENGGQQTDIAFRMASSGTKTHTGLFVHHKCNRPFSSVSMETGKN